MKKLKNGLQLENDMELRCHKCSIFLGEMSKGKLKKGTVLLCVECIEKIKMIEDFGNYNKSTGKTDMPDFFKDIFKNFDGKK